MEVTATLIDVCLSSFLHDHHNRRGELLLGAYVDGTTTLADLRSELLQELQAYGHDLVYGRDDELDDAAARAAIDELFAGHSDLSRPFDASLEVIAEEDREDMGGDEMCQAWVLLQWEPKEEEEAA